MAKVKADPKYFRFPKPIEGTIIAFLMVVFYCALFSPESVILDYVGPLGNLARYMSKHHMGLLRLTLYITIAVHAGEAVYARKLCRQKGISSTMTTVMWMTQTFVIGFPSLLQLVAYKPDLAGKTG